MFPDEATRHELINRIAYRCYEERLSRIAELELKTQLDDWLDAERSLRDKVRDREILFFTPEILESHALDKYNYRCSDIKYLKSQGALDDWLAAEKEFEEDNFLFITVGMPYDAPSFDEKYELERLITQPLESRYEAETREYGVRVLSYDPPFSDNGVVLLELPTGHIVESLSTAVSIVAAAGGLKWLVDVFKAWVEDRKGRKITFKKGDVEIELQGGLSEKEIERALRLFKEHFEESRIIKP